ncbi:MAG: RNA methyltransferase [Alphaproteobacteria bacterium]|nr:MAG: RNA methyltransferase [Alphaproteobacteria bacterium]
MNAPVVILVRPQMAENIGSTARAMLNCGLHELRLVAPREPWPLTDPWRGRCWALASGAEAVLEQVQVFPDTSSALADLHHVYATTARGRDMVKPVLTARAAATHMRCQTLTGTRCGMMFGPERTGLINDDLALAQVLVTIPLNPDYTSLNLAQAVLIQAYEWWQAGLDNPVAETVTLGDSRPASSGEFEALMDRLEGALDRSGFFTTPEIRPRMARNIRNGLKRAELTEQEVRTWHGIITALCLPQPTAGQKSPHSDDN